MCFSNQIGTIDRNSKFLQTKINFERLKVWWSITAFNLRSVIMQLTGLIYSHLFDSTLFSKDTSLAVFPSAIPNGVKAFGIYSFGVKTAACSVIPFANLSLFSLRLSIIIMGVTNVLFRESLPSTSQENVDSSWESLASLIMLDILNLKKAKFGGIYSEK